MNNLKDDNTNQISGMTMFSKQIYINLPGDYSGVIFESCSDEELNNIVCGEASGEEAFDIVENYAKATTGKGMSFTTKKCVLDNLIDK